MTSRNRQYHFTLLLGSIPLLSSEVTLGQEGHLRVQSGRPAGAVILSQLDNPDVATRVQLAANYSGNTNRSGILTQNFRAQYDHVCTDGDPLCRSSDPVFGDSRVFPNVFGFINPGDELDLVAPGVSIGFEPSTFTLFLNEISFRNQAGETLEIALDPLTLVQPVDVVIVLPDPSATFHTVDYRARAQQRYAQMTPFLDVGQWRALFDREFTIRDVVGASPPGESESFQAAIEHRLDLEPQADRAVHVTTLGGSDLRFRNFAPDDVFVQCGVQFRLRSVIAITEGDPIRVFFENPDTGQNAEICGALAANGRIRTWARAGILDEHQAGRPIEHPLGENLRDETGELLLYPTTHSREILYGTPGPNPGKVLVIARDICATGDTISGREFFGLASENVAAVEASQRGSKPDYLIAHELGHTLGNPENHAGGCGGDDTISVNCTGASSPRVGGCSTWRDDGVTPYNCVDDVDEVDARSCSQMRGRTSRALSLPSDFFEGLPDQTALDLWLNAGDLGLSLVSSPATGGRALQVPGGGYRALETVPFDTRALGQVGNRLSLDVRLPELATNPHWYGDISVFVSVPDAGLYNGYVGTATFQGLARGVFQTVEFSVSDEVQAALVQGLSYATFTVAVNTPDVAPVLLDDMRFSGELQPVAQADLGETTLEDVLSLNVADAWKTLGPTDVEINSGMLTLSTAGYQTIMTRWFTGGEELEGASMVRFRVETPADPPNPFWLGDVQGFLSCPALGLYKSYLGYHSLGESPEVSFGLTDAQAASLADGRGRCRLEIALNTGGGTHVISELAVE